MIPQMAAAAGVNEDLKAADPIRWAGMMNTIKAQVEESIWNDLIFRWYAKHVVHIIVSQKLPF